MLTLLDTGFAVALFHQNDWHHQAVLQVVQQLRGTIVFPVPAITETVYLLRREACNTIHCGPHRQPLRLENPVTEDFDRAAELMLKYADADLDFVDALIAAIAERLNITRILTLDQRDFRLIRPRHCEAFEILPA
jgi:uncharacterized protein